MTRGSCSIVELALTARGTTESSPHAGCVGETEAHCYPSRYPLPANFTRVRAKIHTCLLSAASISFMSDL